MLQARRVANRNLHRHHHRGQFFGFDQRRKFRPWHDRGFEYGIRRELAGQRPEHAGFTGRPGWWAARRRTARSPTQTARGDGLSTCPRASAQPGSLKIGSVRPPQPITPQLAQTLPHQEGDHAGAGRGGRGGWRAAHERRHLVPGAQEAPGPPPWCGGGTPIRSADARRACVRAAVAIHRERAAAKRCQGRRGAAVSRA